MSCPPVAVAIRCHHAGAPLSNQRRFALPRCEPCRTLLLKRIQTSDPPARKTRVAALTIGKCRDFLRILSVDSSGLTSSAFASHRIRVHRKLVSRPLNLLRKVRRLNQHVGQLSHSQGIGAVPIIVSSMSTYFSVREYHPAKHRYSRITGLAAFGIGGTFSERRERR